MAAPAAQARSLETVLQDDAQLLHRPDDQLRRSLEELRYLGVDRLRITAGWSVLTRSADAGSRPLFDATDPRAYEQDRWRNLDRAVVLAHQYGFKVMLDVAFWAPKWASHDAPGDRGRTDVDPQAYRDFAVAVARRYSGSFVISPHAGGYGAGHPLPSDDARYLAQNYGDANSDAPGAFHDGMPSTWLAATGDRSTTLDAYLGAAGGGAAPTRALPRVDVLTLWNEPNHTSFLRPQWERDGHAWVPRSPQAYRAMVALAYPAVKAVRPDATVLVGGTSGHGSYSADGSGGVPPLRFLRELACVDARYHPLRRSGCDHFSVVPGDGWAHHPYSLSTAPAARAAASHPDDVPISELPRLGRVLSRLVAMGRLAPGVRNIWVTEYGYETNPPVANWKFSTGDQAKFLTWAEYLAWRTPSVRSFAQFLLRDLPAGAFRVGTSQARAFGQWQSGLLFDNDVPKLAAQTFRAGLYAERVRHARLRLWGRLRLAPGPHSVVIETLRPHSHKWRTLRTRAPGQRVATTGFVIDGRDAFDRFALNRGPARRRFRLRVLENGAWLPAPPSFTAESR